VLIKRLQISNFRIFSETTIEPSDGLNLLFGANATGKTSILEAIGTLATLRSFRSAKLNELTRYSADGFRVIALTEEQDGRRVMLGLEKNTKEIVLKAEGRRLQKVSELAFRLPVQIIHPDSHVLISGGPKQRRRFLDWGVFHVEPGFLEQWRRYERSIRQRNAAIRSGQSWQVVSTWDGLLSESAAAIHGYRQRYIEELNTVLPPFTESIFNVYSVEVEYQPGWDVEQDLRSVLEAYRERDKRRGFTCAGPHRAELLFRVNDKPADQHVSRGQQKMLVFALLLSQVELLRQKTGRRCVLLLDDLAAELDTEHCRRLLDRVAEMSVQSFITSVQKEAFLQNILHPYKVFHVEPGNIREVI